LIVSWFSFIQYTTYWDRVLVLEDSGEVKIYYGAADTMQCLAMAQLTDLAQSYAGLIPRSLLRVFVKRAADG
jgi:hypothetical protein